MTQLDKKLALLPDDMQGQIMVDSITNLDRTLPQEEKTVYIFDEADLTIENSLVNFDGTQLKGLFAYKDEQCYHFTATLEAYWKKCWLKVMGTGNVEVF